MSKQKFTQISTYQQGVIASIDVTDLKTLLRKVNKVVQINSKDRNVSITVTWSAGYKGNLEIHLHKIQNNERDENLHIDQEVQVTKDEEGFLFLCPLSHTEVQCRRLYLRADYPLFGSAQALNVT